MISTGKSGHHTSENILDSQAVTLDIASGGMKFRSKKDLITISLETFRGVDSITKQPLVCLFLSFLKCFDAGGNRIFQFFEFPNQ